MRVYYLIYWDNGDDSTIIINANDELDLYHKLIQQFPNLEEINLNKFNYNYISNASHWFASGYISEIKNTSISNALSPAHFNKNFFYILGYDNIKEIRKDKLNQINDKNTE